MAPKVGPLPPVSDRRGGDDGALLFKGSAMTMRGAFAALSYMTCAVLLVMFNKAALSSYNFITLFQLATMESVRRVNVPMYATVRRTTVVFTMIVEYLLTRQKYTRHVVGSAYGYGMVFAANMTTAIYLASISRVGISSGLNSFGLMWCNGIVCGPILLLWTYFRGDLGLTMNFPHFHPVGFQDLFTIGLGWLLFGGLPFDVLNVTGQILGFVGSGFYEYCKIKRK